MVKMIMEFVQNRRFTFTTGDNKKQARPAKKRRSSGIGFGSPHFQHLYVQPVLHDYQRISNTRSNILAVVWKPEGLEGDFKSSYDNISAYF